MILKSIKRVELPNRIKVAWFSNSPTMFTGYSRVSRTICEILAKDSRFEVSMIGELQGPAQPLDINGVPLYLLGDMNNIQKSLVDVLQRINPHVLIFLEDSFTLTNFGLHRVNYDPIKTILYIPQDGNFSPSIHGLTMMRKVDLMVAMSKFSHMVNKNDGFIDSKNHMIWHGVCLNKFHPIDVNKRNEYRREMGFKDDEFLLFSLARNSMRKRNQRLIEGFAKAALQNDKLKLVLHISHPFRDDNNLKDFCERVLPKLVKGSEKLIGKNIFFTEESIKNIDLDDNNLAKLYQISDMTLSFSSGEGFGLLMAESIACGIPCIHCDYTTPRELLLDTYNGKYEPRGVGVKCITTDVASYNVEHGLADIDDGAKKILYYSQHPDEVKKLSKDCRRFAEDNLNWHELVQKWKEEILYVLTG